MKPKRLLAVLLVLSALVMSCSSEYEPDIQQEETTISATQILEISKATKLLNVLALQEILKNKNFTESAFIDQEVQVRSSACPIVSPDPDDYDPNNEEEYTLLFDQCAFSDQLIGVAGTPIVIGEVKIKLQGKLGHSGCEFNISGENLSIGAINYDVFDITQTHNRAITSDTCITRDIIDFQTKINQLEFTVDGLDMFGEPNNTIKILSSSNGRTRYRDYGCNTDIDEFLTIIDDRIVIQADTIVSSRINENEITISNNIYTDVSAEFDLICPCPISQAFNIVVAGNEMLTCFDFDNEVCNDDITCITTTIPLDCRF